MPGIIAVLCRQWREPDAGSDRANTARYRPPARLLHWIMAAIVITMVPHGIAVNYLPWDAFQDWLLNLHKSLGIVVLALVIARLAYRLTADIIRCPEAGVEPARHSPA